MELLIKIWIDHMAQRLHPRPNSPHPASPQRRRETPASFFLPFPNHIPIPMSSNFTKTTINPQLNKNPNHTHQSFQTSFLFLPPTIKLNSNQQNPFTTPSITKFRKMDQRKSLNDVHRESYGIKKKEISDTVAHWHIARLACRFYALLVESSRVASWGCTSAYNGCRLRFMEAQGPFVRARARAPCNATNFAPNIYILIYVFSRRTGAAALARQGSYY